MSSGVGVTYELEFVIKNDKARKAIEAMIKNAERLVKTLDRVTLSRATGALKKFNNELKSSETNLEKITRYNAVLGKSVRNPYKEVKKGADSASKSIDRMVKRIETGFLYKVGSFLFQQGQQAFSDFSNIDFDVRAASAKTGGFGKDYNELFQLVNKVGGDTRFTNADAAKALNAGATLGIKKEELKEILPAAAQLAQAFNTEIPFAMETTKMHMNTYVLSQDKATMVTDMLAATAKNSAADLERLATGFQYVGAQAKALDIPLEQVYAVLGKMNDSGIMGSSAGTAFNNFLVNLSNFKKRAKLEELIGKVTDEKGNLMDLANILQRIKTVTDKMGNADRASVFQNIFGIRGGKTVNTFMNQGVDGLLKLQEQIKNSSGLTKMMSKYMMSGSAGAIEELLSTLESAFQTTFKALSPLIVPVAIALRALAQAIIFVNEKMPFLGQLIAIFSAMFVGKVIINYLLTKLPALITLIKTAGASFLGVKGIIMGGLVIALIILFNLFERWMEYLSQNEAASREWELILRQLGYVFNNLIDLIVEVVKALFGLSGGQEKTKSSGDKTIDTMKELNKTLFQMTIKLQKAKRWVEENAEKIQKWGKAFLGLFVAVEVIKLLTGAVGLFNLVLEANPIVFAITMIILAIVLLWNTFKWLYDNVAWFRDGVNWAWNMIKDHWQAVVGLIVGGPFGMLIGALVELYNKNEDFRNFVDGAWEAIKKIFKTVCDEIVKTVDSVTIALKGAKSALTDLMNGDWDGLKNKWNNHVNNAKKGPNGFERMFGPKKNATGTDYFGGGYTTTDEQGDEAIWLPQGTMIARNMTTRDMARNIQAIKNNTKNGIGSSGSTVVNHNHFEINVADGKSAVDEIVAELKDLGVI